MTSKAAKLMTVADQIRGVTYSAGEAVDAPQPGFVPLLRANNISDSGIDLSELIFVPKERVSEKQILQKGDILVAASSGSLSVVGKAAYCDLTFEATFGAFCKVIRPIKDKVLPRYLSHYFQTAEYRRLVSSMAAGANINNLRNEHLNDLLIPLPSLAEQKRIAGILDAAERVRDEHLAAARKADELKRALASRYLES